MGLLLRTAYPDDAQRIAVLHADSWRRHYRGAYSDAYLDGDLVIERQEVWAARLAEPAGTATVLAEDGDELAGFVHVKFGDDPRWGSLVDNLHVTRGRQRGGIGRSLLAAAATAVLDQAGSPALSLWVLEQNTAAQAFYQACGGTCVEKDVVLGPPSRVDGTPGKLRMAWPEASALLR